MTQELQKARAALAKIKQRQAQMDNDQALQRKSLTDEEIQNALEAEFLGCDTKRNWQDDLRVARCIEALIKENT